MRHLWTEHSRQMVGNKPRLLAVIEREDEWHWYCLLGRGLHNTKSMRVGSMSGSILEGRRECRFCMLISNGWYLLLSVTYSLFSVHSVLMAFNKKNSIYSTPRRLGFGLNGFFDSYFSHSWMTFSLDTIFPNHSNYAPCPASSDSVDEVIPHLTRAKSGIVTPNSRYALSIMPSNVPVLKFELKSVML